MIIRISESAWNQFAKQLLERRDVETAGIILCEPFEHDVVVAREFILVPDSGYTIRAIDRLQLDPIFLNRALRSARDRGWTVMTIHTHPGAKRAWFSWADDQGDERLMPSLHHQITARVHGAMVLAGSGSVVARVFTEGGAAQEAPVHIVGRTMAISVWDGGGREERYQRQELALVGAKLWHPGEDRDLVPALRHARRETCATEAD
jgi:hypothetical protein